MIKLVSLQGCKDGLTHANHHSVAHEQNKGQIHKIISIDAEKPLTKFNICS
jgi:hypothetical protein